MNLQTYANAIKHVSLDICGSKNARNLIITENTVYFTIIGNYRLLDY